MRAANSHYNRISGGFSILEIMIAISVFVSIFFSVGWVYNRGSKMMESEEEKRIALALAQEMIDEIMTKAMRDPDINEENGAGECWECINIADYARIDLDDIDDYDGWDRGVDADIETMYGSPMNGVPDVFGNDTPDYRQFPERFGKSLFRRRVSIDNIQPSDNGTLSISDNGTGFYRVSVMVSSLKDFDPDEDGLQPSFLPVVLTTLVSHTYR